MADEEKLIKKLRRKDRDALELIIRKYTPYVSVIVYNIIGYSMTKEDVEEVVSDVFISLWKHADSLEEAKGGLRPYLGAIARNSAKNKLRKQTIHSELELCDNMISNAETEKTIMEKEEKQMLVKAISSLGEPDDEIFMRYYFYDEKIKSISQITGLCLSTVKTKLARGRNKLREIISQDGRGCNE